MSTTIAQMYVYDVDRAGACTMHYLESDGETAMVSACLTVFSPGFFKQQEAMHQRMGHTLTMEMDNAYGTVWTVRIGRGDFDMLSSVFKSALWNLFSEGGPVDASQN